MIAFLFPSVVLCIYCRFRAGVILCNIGLPTSRKCLWLSLEYASHNLISQDDSNLTPVLVLTHALALYDKPALRILFWSPTVEMISYVVTGANRGIGFGFIQTLSADPNNVVFALTRNKATSVNLLNLESKQKNVHVLQADITNVPALRAVAKAVENVTGGTLNVLINNGAYLETTRAEYTLEMYDGKEDILDEDFNNFFKVNTLGVIKTINIFLPLLRKASHTALAKVITISSAAGDMEFNKKANIDFFVPYAVSKAAVNMAMAKYATRFKDENLLFLSLSPGFVNTMTDQPQEVQDELYGNYAKLFAEAYPEWSGTPLTPEQSVAAVLDTVSKLTVKDSGKFMSHNGDNETWI
ncbi:hypothetical protein QCA50_016709 [Cerrena zonata]|uniref:Uncharacterized protein n=1 Tax=Cerrena zonata TaxID=2478898 RepID=A0AAW0FU17_9APHY